MKTVETEDVKLPVMEHFYTIQGEGYHQGKASYFIRLGGCDVGCTWCDVKDSWEAEKHTLWSVNDIVKAVVNSGAKICVLPGGAQMLTPLSGLTLALQKNTIRTPLETSGAYPLSGKWNWICVSPKRFKLPLKQCLKAADELKAIIYHKNDFRFAEEYASEVSAACKLFLQPEWSKEKVVLPLMIDYIKKHQQWEISLQTHKYMNIP